VGYASDPELEVLKVKQSSDTAIGEPMDENDGIVTQPRGRHRVGFRSHGSEEVSKTASWQDLFKSVVIIVPKISRIYLQNLTVW
jgi:hypothetical protein